MAKLFALKGVRQSATYQGMSSNGKNMNQPMVTAAQQQQQHHVHPHLNQQMAGTSAHGSRNQPTQPQGQRQLHQKNMFSNANNNNTAGHNLYNPKNMY